MSIQAIAWVLDYSESCGLDRLVFLCMAHHDDNGIVGISKATVAEEARVSEATVWRSQGHILQLGEIAPLNKANAPQWWKDIDVRRRPNLWLMTAFLGSRSAMAEAVENVRQGSRRDRAGVAPDATRSSSSRRSTIASPSFQEQGGRFRGELEPISRLSEERCPDCGGTGWREVASGVVAVCAHGAGGGAS